MNKKIIELAPSILSEIKAAKRVLLHCHPFPDPDSVGSVLSMASYLRDQGIKFKAILGDSLSYPKSLSSYKDKDLLEVVNFGSLDLTEFDLFIILDSSSLTQISQLSEVKFPNTLKTIVIDHHKTNVGYGNLNLIVSEYCSTSQILIDLFKIWGAKISSDMALYLFVGMFSDCGGFKYDNSTADVLKSASEMVNINPNYHRVVFEIENSKSELSIEMMGIAFSNLEKYCNGRVAISFVPNNEVQKRNLSKSDALEGLVGSYLRSVEGWDVVASLVEFEPNVVIVSLRTRDEIKFDVSLVAKSVGVNGGGHRGAAGTTINDSLENSKKILVDGIMKAFPELRS